MNRFLLLLVLFSFLSFNSRAQDKDSIVIKSFFDEALTNGDAYPILRHLCKEIGHRLSGSENAEKAVQYTFDKMKELGFDTVFLQEVRVPKWERGKPEKCVLTKSKKFAQKTLNVTALGNSVGTGNKGLKANIVEVTNFEEMEKWGRDSLEGKIVFYNIPMNPTYISTGRAYGEAARQRYSGPSEASKYGAIATVNRSLTLLIDDNPHTGSTGYKLNLPKIPGFAVSTKDAEELSRLLKDEPEIEMYLESTCGIVDTVISHNVIGEIRGSEFPDEYIIVGGHLDSWDLAEGAQDDGAGSAQSIDALALYLKLGIKPRHSLRTVMFMNEENGLAGGKKYAELSGLYREKHVAALESDGGGGRPLGFGCTGTDEEVASFMSFKKYFEPYDIFEFRSGGGGADIGPLKAQGVPLIGISPNSQRYFDYHHSKLDVFETINRRELHLGSAALASMIYLIDQRGL